MLFLLESFSFLQRHEQSAKERSEEKKCFNFYFQLFRILLFVIVSPKRRRNLCGGLHFTWMLDIGLLSMQEQKQKKNLEMAKHHGKKRKLFDALHIFDAVWLVR